MKRSTIAAIGAASLIGIASYVFIAKPFSASAPAASVGQATTAGVAVSAPPIPVPSAAPTAAPAPVIAHGFDRLPDGQPVPELPKTAPSSVKFGVVLFEYDGAQPAPGHPASKTRSKTAALELAKGTIELARTDFAAAVAKGDRGSVANAGKIARGILEPSVEYLLFTLNKGEVRSEPIDTPRGYWVVRRIE